MNRCKTFLKNTDFRARFRFLVLIVFPLWVCSLPLFHFAVWPWLAGFVMPYAFIGLFRRKPGLQLSLIMGMLLSCVVLFQVKLPSHYVTALCCWVWFCLAFGAGTQWWMLSSED